MRSLVSVLEGSAGLRAKRGIGQWQVSQSKIPTRKTPAIPKIEGRLFSLCLATTKIKSIVSDDMLRSWVGVPLVRLF
jgi:hypothetical protein